MMMIIIFALNIIIKEFIIEKFKLTSNDFLKKITVFLIIKFKKSRILKFLKIWILKN